jgi:Saxitoxin biosynthesis operon protein SxtJ
VNNARATVSHRELRNFGLLLGALFASIFGVSPILRHRSASIWPWLFAIVLWSAALIRPSLLSYVHRGWTKFGLALGWINTRAILTLLFAVAIVPVGFVMRLFGRDRMARKIEHESVSYRVVSRNRDAQDMEHPF